MGTAQKIAGVGSPGSTSSGTVAPAGVTITSLVAQLLPADANGNVSYGLSATYTVPGGWTGTGVHGYYELPDQSGSAQFTLDGTTNLSGSASLAGAWRPVSIGTQAYSSGDPTHYFFFQVPAPATAMTLRLRLVGMNKDADPPVSKTSPSATVSLGPPAINLSGTARTSNVTGFTITVVSPVDGGNGILRTPVTASFTEPTDPKYGGVELKVVWDNQALTGQSFFVNAGHSDPVSFAINTPTAVNTFTIWAVSYDINGNSNGIVLGVTPAQPGSTGAPSGTTINGAVLNNSSVPLAVFVPTIRPVVNYSTPPTLPNSTLYPPGTYGSDLSNPSSPQLTRVNAAGTAWEKGVAAGDLQLNSVTAGVAAFGAVSASSLGSGTFPVGVIYAGTVYLTQLGSGTLPVGVAYIGTVNVSQLAAGTATFSGTVRFQNTGATAYVEITSGAVNIAGGSLTSPIINGGSLNGTSLSLNLNSTTTTISNSVSGSRGFGYVGLSIAANGANAKTGIAPAEIFIIGNASTQSTVQIFDDGVGGTSHGKIILGDSNGSSSDTITLCPATGISLIGSGVQSSGGYDTSGGGGYSVNGSAGSSGTFYVATTPGGSPTTAITFSRGIKT